MMSIDPTRAMLALAALAVLATSARSRLAAHAAQDAPPAAREVACTVDLTRTGTMRDILSNVLNRSNVLSRSIVRPSPGEFLNDAVERCGTSEELVRATAAHFGIELTVLAAEVERFRHINCHHPPVADPTYMPPDSSRGPDPEDRSPRAEAFAPLELSAFARDVTVHVVLHELGHALVREFDLPILGNEETMADAFATHYLTTYLPERAVDVLVARATSLMIEAREVPRAEWPVRGEHDNDARRAYQIAALAVAADPEKYRAVAEVAGMSAEDVRDASDYGAEIHRSWRRILQPLRMPVGARSTEARVIGDDSVFRGGSGAHLLAELDAVVRGFDWHSQVTIRFTAGDGSAAWSRSQRTITVRGGYMRRFVEQGVTAAGAAAPAGDAEKPER